MQRLDRLILAAAGMLLLGPNMASAFAVGATSHGDMSPPLRIFHSNKPTLAQLEKYADQQTDQVLQQKAQYALGSIYEVGPKALGRVYQLGPNSNHPASQNLDLALKYFLACATGPSVVPENEPDHVDLIQGACEFKAGGIYAQKHDWVKSHDAYYQVLATLSASQLPASAATVAARALARFSAQGLGTEKSPIAESYWLSRAEYYVKNYSSPHLSASPAPPLPALGLAILGYQVYTGDFQIRDRKRGLRLMRAAAAAGYLPAKRQLAIWAQSVHHKG